jgi:acetyltransferase-like isoleucine patch superfamily enzyme
MTNVLADDWFPRPLPAGLRMGQRCFLYSAFSFFHCSPTANNDVLIGDDTGIYHGTFFELGPQARVAVGNFCTLVGPIIRAEREVTIGNYVFVAHEVVISDCDGPQATTRSQPTQTANLLSPPTCSPRPVRIEDDVWIGMRAIILAGVTIGAGSIIGAGAVVSEDVPPLTVVSGNPGKVVRALAGHDPGRDSRRPA